ncbi:trigger factor Tig [Actinoplanes sp. SE50]|uniref:FKBP-type peptidyl-prolyl cis-trans isomerase n=1 Tax=unclassified Actinoplanes TaxID=2626549 RepID=UPI00023ECC88|nr:MULTISPECIES: FKBP-type peptidyl-prolyl cis-trans isomerase [unclassified Actinoplanes]AEV83772.1 Trigger factor [Actinoplanes sp. SE50/110]ATO82084.1 trigger factor Tig [Actinoplanes sp. SE50]SLL99491.1 trigger factor Tig [Actinoplanes sp. SE50/110]
MSDRTTPSDKRRGQAIAGGVAGALVFVVLVVVFFVVRGGHDKQPAATSAAVQQDSAAAVAPPPAEASPAAGLPPELSHEPDVQPGTGGPLTELVALPLIVGTGPVVAAGQTITVNYKLIPYKGGAVMDSSWSRHEPFTTVIGAGQVIKGWDQGIPGQHVGSRIQLDVPAALAYKDQDLRFVVDILAAH